MLGSGELFQRRGVFDDFMMGIWMRFGMASCVRQTKYCVFWGWPFLFFLLLPNFSVTGCSIGSLCYTVLVLYCTFLCDLNYIDGVICGR